MVKTDEGVIDFDRFESRHYIAVDGSSENDIKAAFDAIQIIDTDGEIKFITKKMSEADVKQALNKINGRKKSQIRLI